MRRCGGRAGYERLAEYASDVRAVLSRHARSELSELTGCDYGADTAAWKKWIAARETLPVKLTSGRRAFVRDCAAKRLEMGSAEDAVRQAG